MRVSEQNFQKSLADKGALVDKEIERVIPKTGRIAGLNDVAWYTLSSGGKRIRPAMCLLVTEKLKGNERYALRFGASMELLHTFLLIHDDIEDGDRVRRNKPSAWVEYGLAHAVNSGDYILTIVYDAVCSLVELGMEETKAIQLLKEVNMTMKETGEGQAIEVNSRTRNDLTENDYMEIVQKKTGSYLTLPMIGAAIISNCPSELTESVRKYGRFIGPAFQIRDDIIDLTQGKGRGEIGCDIKEGKRSFLVTYVSSVCSVKERKMLFGVLNKSRDRKTDVDIETVVELFKKYDAVEHSEEKVTELMNLGKQAIAALPDELRQLLDMFADFTMKREK